MAQACVVPDLPPIRVGGHADRTAPARGREPKHRTSASAVSVHEPELAQTPRAAPSPGDDIAFASAYRDHHQAVTAVASRVCGPAHAADVTQEVFAALWRHPASFDPDRGSLRAFLTSVARHKAIDLLRHESSLRGREGRADAWQRPIRTPVDEELLRGEVAAQVRAALNTLPPSEREAITLAYFAGLSYKATAARLGQPEGTTKSRIRSGLRRLQPGLANIRANLDQPSRD